MADTLEVTYIHEQMRGAPVLSGTAGTFIALLDAFLLTGWGLVTATSVSVLDGIATAMLPSNSAFEEGAVIQIAGATPAELNDRARVLPGASSTQVQWATTAADGAATGTITIKYAPQGSWEKAFSGANKAAYRSTDVTGTRFYLRIDDTGTTTCRARGYETMTDIDTGTGPFPTDAQISGGGYWHKSGSANATAVGYMLAADNVIILCGISPGMSSSASLHGAAIRGFGDVVSLASGGDGYACAISVSSANSSSSSGARPGSFDAPYHGASAIYFPRAFSGVGGSVLCGCAPYCGSAVIDSSSSGNDSTCGAFPSSVDGQLKLSRRFITQLASVDNTPRSGVPGVLTVPQTGVLSSVSRLDKLSGDGAFSGRALLACSVTSHSTQFNSSPVGVSFIDITGPWR